MLIQEAARILKPIFLSWACLSSSLNWDHFYHYCVFKFSLKCSYSDKQHISSLCSHNIHILIDKVHNTREIRSMLCYIHLVLCLCPIRF